MKYQWDYARNFPAVKQVASRQRKAIKILRILTDFMQREDLCGLACLDLGCSIGVIGQVLAGAGARVWGLDIDLEALHEAARASAGSARYVLGDAGATPFPGEAFDLVICSQVYEHAPSLVLLVSEIYRVLKSGGICFFSGPNRWAVMEEHYHLPFLSWLPRHWANEYVQRVRRAQEYYEHPRSARELRQALREFLIQDYTPRLLHDPAYFALDDEMGWAARIVKLVPASFWRWTSALAPNFNWVLRKP
jgi:2-polyprenyl-3-methyl-5-hydroxy-6-metoxy-1,4-benzoquinol methylase